MIQLDNEVAEVARWFASPRFEGIISLFSARQVVEQRGTIDIDYTVARTAAERLGLERVLLVPAARPPHKPGRELASGADRLALLAVAVADDARLVPDDVELARGTRDAHTLADIYGYRDGWGLPGEDDARAITEFMVASGVAEYTAAVTPPGIRPRAGAPARD